MKKTLLLLVIVSLSHFCYSQSSPLAVLKKALASAKTDTLKIKLLDSLGFRYIGISIDSCLMYAKRASVLLGDYNDLNQRAFNQRLFGVIYERTGNYPKAMESYLAGLQAAEKAGFQEELINLNMRVGYLLAVQQDEKAVAYLMKGKAIVEIADRRDNDQKTWSYYLIGDAFQKLNRLDSALKYLQYSYELAVSRKETGRFPQILVSLGDIQYKLKHYGQALEYYKMADDSSRYRKNMPRLSQALAGKAFTYQKNGMMDSALVNAKASFHLLQSYPNPENVYPVSLLLAEIYNSKKQKDSAYYYLKMATITKDSLFNKEKVQQLQNFTLNEQERQQELAATKLRAREERRSNLQLLSIALFILVFIGFVLLLNRQNVKPRIIEFMGLLAVLLLFEFIALLIHPFIEELTNHTPALMLGILVLIAAVLIPLHHRAAGWVKLRLVKKYTSDTQ